MNGVPPPDVIRITRDPWTEPFWAATAEHRLVIPRCGSCGTNRFPPGPFCFVCRSQAVEWDDHTGSGSIYTFTVVRHPVIPDMAEHLPVIAAVVALDGLDEIRLVGNVVDAEPDQVEVGQAVTMDWYDVRDGDTVPIFRLAPGSDPRPAAEAPAGAALSAGAIGEARVAERSEATQE